MLGLHVCSRVGLLHGLPIRMQSLVPLVGNAIKQEMRLCSGVSDRPVPFFDGGRCLSSGMKVIDWMVVRATCTSIVYL